MKAVLLIVFAFCFLGGISQPNVPFNLLNYQQFGKPVVASGKRPLDAKYKYYDPANFVTRAYKDTTEVRLVLPLNQRDQGQKVLVNTGGTLLNGVITGGTNADWWYKDGTADNNLIPYTAAYAVDSTILVSTKFGTDGVGAYTFVNPNSFTHTVVGNAVRVTGTSSGLANYIKHTAIKTSTNYWSAVWTGKWQAGAARFAPGVYSLGTPLAARVDINSGGVTTLKIELPGTGTYTTSTGSITLSAGDSFVVRLSQQDRMIYASIRKPSTGEIITSFKVFDLATEAIIVREIQPAVYYGTGSIDEIDFSFTDMHSPYKFAVLGDSRMVGATASTGTPSAQYGYDARTFQGLVSHFGPGLNFSAGGNTTTEVFNTLDQVKLYRPGISFVDIGTNNALGGNDSTTFAGFLKTIIYRVDAYGSIPVLITTAPWDAAAIATNHRIRQYKDHILGKATDLKVVNTWATLVTPSDSSLLAAYNSGDGHENALGNVEKSNTIVLAMQGVLSNGITGTTVLTGGGRVFDMIDVGHGSNDIRSNANLQLTFTSAAHSLRVFGAVQSFATTGHYFSSEPQYKRFRFSDDIYNVVHSDLSSNYTKTIVSFDSSGALRLHSPVQLQIGPTGMTVLGHSIAVGQNASVQDSAWSTRTTSAFSLLENNLAVGGSGVSKAASNFFVDAPFGNTKMTVVMAGLNDIRRSHDGKTYLKIMNAYKAIFANHNLKSFVEPGSLPTSIVKYGTWNDAFQSAAVGSKGTSLGSYTALANDSIKYTFADSTVVVFMTVADGVTETATTSFTIWVDDVLKGTYSLNGQTDGVSDGVYNNQRTPTAFWFTGLGAGVHKVVLKNAASGNMYVNAFGHFSPTLSTVPIVFMHDPKLNSAGYAASPNQANDTYINLLNTRIDSLVATFPAWFQKYTVPTNNYYNVAGGIDADNIHPNNVGHRQIFNALMATVTSLGTIPPNGTIGISAFTGKLQAATNGQLKDVAYQQDVLGFSGSNIPQAVPYMGANYLSHSTSTSNALTFDDSRNQLSIGNARIGDFNAFDGLRTIEVGRNINGYPSIRGYYAAGSANNKQADWYLDGTGYHYRFIDDASNGVEWLNVVRNGNTLSSAQFAGPLSISSTVTSPSSKAMLDIRSTNKGVLFPRLNTAQRDAMLPSDAGMLIYNAEIGEFESWNGVEWVALGTKISTVLRDNSDPNRALGMIDASGNVSASTTLFANNIVTTGFIDTLVNYFVVTDATSGALVLSQARKTKAIVDPAGFLSTKSLTLPVGTSKSFEVLILFGGQLGYGADVVGTFTLNVSGGNVLYAPTTFYNLKGGDAIRVDFHAGNVTYRRIIL